MWKVCLRLNQQCSGTDCVSEPAFDGECAGLVLVPNPDSQIGERVRAIDRQLLCGNFWVSGEVDLLRIVTPKPVRGRRRGGLRRFSNTHAVMLLALPP
jgi:hypothetical protein